MELQVMMEASTETLNGPMWLGHSPSPPYQRLSPSVRHEGRDVIAAQQVSMGYHVSDSGILWHDKRVSPKNSPHAADDHLHSNVRSRDHSPTSEQQSFHQPSNGVKRRSPETNQTIAELERKHPRRDESIGSNGSAQWSSRQVEELAEHLAADFDGSLSALAATDLANAVVSYNMSEALLALPSLTVFKQEAPSPENQTNKSNPNHVSQKNLTGQRQNGDNISLSTEPDSNTNTVNNSTTTTTTTTTIASNNNNGANNPGNGVRHSNNGDRGQSTTTTLHQLLYSNNEDYPLISSSGNHVSSSQQGNESNEDSRFQYVLAAATSIATKLNEETLTYLNQGQSYEIKLKKLGDLSDFRGKILKSSIRICFHERRLQYTEKEQMQVWQRTRPGERLLEVDVPLSYGMMDVSQTSSFKNSVEFMWDPTKEVGVYIKVNCISTEFTPKKHGGEKGVPFRIHVETRLPGGPRLHAASCQVKVFKLKGADRKHKQDRDKILRRATHEQDKYQPSYDCTVLSDIPLESLTSASPESQNDENPYAQTESTSHDVGGAALSLPAVPATLAATAPTTPPITGLDQAIKKNINGSSIPVSAVASPAEILPEQPSRNDLHTINGQLELSHDANAMETSAWLRSSRFQAFESTFSNFSAADILRLSRDDLIQICGLADGIRLFNALHAKAPTPKLSLYFAIEGNPHSLWRIVYLESLTSGALASKLLTTFNLPNDRLHSILLQGPHGIHVLVSNELVANMKDESMFLVETIRDSSNEHYKLLLKPSSR